MNHIHDDQACQDQTEAYTRDYAEKCRDLFDAFLREDFTRTEAFGLTQQYIDNGIAMYAST